MGRLLETEKGKESVSEKTKASTMLGLQHEDSVCPSAGHPLPTSQLIGLDFQRISKMSSNAHCSQQPTWELWLL